MSSIKNCLNTFLCIHIMEYHAAIKKNMKSSVYKILSFLWEENEKCTHIHICVSGEYLLKDTWIQQRHKTSVEGYIKKLVTMAVSGEKNHVTGEGKRYTFFTIYLYIPFEFCTMKPVHIYIHIILGNSAIDTKGKNKVTPKSLKRQPEITCQSRTAARKTTQHL